MIHVAPTFPQVNLDLLSAPPAGHSGYCSHCCGAPAGQGAPGRCWGRRPPIRSFWAGWQQLGVRLWGLGSSLREPGFLPGTGPGLLGVSRPGEGHSGALGPGSGRRVSSVGSEELADHALLVAGLVGHGQDLKPHRRRGHGLAEHLLRPEGGSGDQGQFINAC